MSELLAEVDEMMRQERIMKLWNDYGGVFISIIAAIILGTGAASAYKAWDSAQKIDSTNVVLELKDNEKLSALQKDDIDIRASVKTIGLLTAAAEEARLGNQEQAVALYNNIINNTQAPDNLLQLAKLNFAKLSDKPAQERLSLLGQIAADQESPWRFHALQEAAVIQANDLGNYDAAIALLNTIIQAPNLAQTQYEKARALAQVYEIEKNQKSSSE